MRSKPVNTTAITGGRVWEGTNAAPIEDGVVVIEDDRITAVGPRGQTPVPADATLIDAAGATVLPGLCDVHVHLSTNSDHRNPVDNSHFRSTASGTAKTLHALRNAQTALSVGFTSLRVMGLRDAGEPTLRNMIDDGLLLGPRLSVAPWWITMTAGHGDLYYPPNHPRGEWDTADGIDQCRKNVRKQVGAGADFIKVMASGGVMSHGDKPEWPNYTVAELAAIVDEAHSFGLPVAAHAHSLEGITRCLDAGVDSIEHGTFIDEEQLVRMKEAGTYLVPTLAIHDWVLLRGERTGAAPDSIAKMRAVAEQRRTSFARAVQLGVNIAMGTDSSGTLCPFGEHARELELYTELGMTAETALRSATYHAAKLMARNDIGSIEVGKLADILVVEGNPLNDVTALRERKNLRTIIKSGRDISHFESEPNVPPLVLSN
jgi:imidazolonepropionase-like amidohydrolase